MIQSQFLLILHVLNYLVVGILRPEKACVQFSIEAKMLFLTPCPVRLDEEDSSRLKISAVSQRILDIVEDSERATYRLHKIRLGSFASGEHVPKRAIFGDFQV